MDQELNYLIMPLYAQMVAEGEDEQRSRVEVFYAAQNMYLPDFDLTGAFLAKVVPVPTTHDLERISARDSLRDSI